MILKVIRAGVGWVWLARLDSNIAHDQMHDRRNIAELLTSTSKAEQVFAGCLREWLQSSKSLMHA